MMEQRSLKNHLKQVRLDKNLSQMELSVLVGVSRNSISSIETGQYCPSARLALLICTVLGVKFEDVFFFE